MAFARKYLEWDSDFFQKKIVSISCSPNDLDLFPAYLLSLKYEKYDLAYLFVDGVSQFNFRYKANLVDEKIVFSIDNIGGFIYSLSVFEFVGNPSELYELSRCSGQYSRFRIDSHFSRDNFCRLYDKWVDNSLNKQYADIVFVYRSNDLIKGFITGRITDDLITIGLISVSEKCRGNGIGTALVQHILAYAYENGCQKLEVATQKANKAACDFYKKFGMKEISQTSIFHFWLNENL